MKDVKFSIQMSSQCRSPEDWAVTKQIVLACEQMGYHSVWFGDHITRGEARLECWTILSALSASTTQIRFGPLVLCNNWRNPALLAKMAASLDVISGGRLEFGIGAGGSKEEHEAYGYVLPKPAERVARLREALRIMKKMWTEDKPSYKGKYYEVRSVLCEPKPLQKPHPPITIGGSGEQLMLKVVARYADRWNISGGRADLSMYLHKKKVLDRYCAQIGRDSEEIEKSYMFPLVVYSSEAELRQLLKRDYENMALRTDLPFEKWLERSLSRYVLGTQDTWLEKIREFIDSGVTHFVISSTHQVDYKRISDLKLFAEKVIARV